MKSTDDAMERILRGLREAEAPEGMERRILKGLEEGIAAEAVSSSGWLRMPVAGWGLGAAGLCALLLVAIGMYRTKLDSAHRTGVAAGTPRAATRQPEGEQKAPQRVAAIEPQPRLHVRRTVAVRSETALASDENVRSLPAPPMPLTEQERLLLKVAHHHNDPELVAMLNPAVRAGREAEEQAEVAKFFSEKK
ncbi:MAG: hypothetical protein JWM43_2783 [Acidobacteriaceae bacterium]|nr:hypothetical protein [Acidobacteriaceae bacterium]